MNTPRIWIAVAVSALGYFVDVFDILLFAVVRTASLKSLGIEGPEALNAGIFLINSQMVGMLLGGVFWGVWGDKRGRLSVLFGSILLYSVANVANAFVQDVPTYAVLRFLAGLGLAGELGAGITLVAEGLPKEYRGIGTTIIATVGVGGGLAASIVGGYWDWRTAYLIAGGMGLALLLLRVSVHESGLFKHLVETESSVKRGDLRLLFASRERVGRYFNCLLPGLPSYFLLAILVTFAPEVGQARGLGNLLTAGNAVFYSYIGFIAGDLGSGLLSQLLRRRRPVIASFVLLTFASSLAMLLVPSPTVEWMHGMYILLGFAAGYWAVLVTSAAEQFGTNLRATVATSVPNFIRGAVVPMTLAVKMLSPTTGLIPACLAVLTVVCITALFCVSRLDESFDRSMDFIEK